MLVVKNPPANAGDIGDMGSIPGSEDSLEKGVATPSSVLVWTIRQAENGTLLFCINQSLSYVSENREKKILMF